MVEESELTQIVLSPVTSEVPEKGADAGTSSLYLVALHGGIPGKMVALGAGPNTLGRGAQNQIRLPELSISRNHATVMVDPGGLVWLTDLGSTNGTFVNGCRLEPHQTVGLRDGDRVGLGPDRMFKLIRTDPLDERHYRQMFERAVRDPLTGLYNRSYFADQVEILAQQGYSRGLGFAVFMIDIDYFKAINDRYGHETGDTVLRAVAGVLHQFAGPDDLVARYGGEEFVAAGPAVSAEQARLRAETLREGFHSLRFQQDAHSWTISASVGVAFAPADSPGSVLSLLRQADDAMYRAKQAGRDRTVIEWPVS